MKRMLYTPLRRAFTSRLRFWSAAALLAGAALPFNAGAVQPAAQATADGLPDHIQRFAASVTTSGDAGGHDFAVLDKSGASVWVFDPKGALVGQSLALVGFAPGDKAPADIGTRPLSRVKPHEKITPAGRFLTEPGTNHKGEDIIWLDYDSALSMHRVRNVPGENRLKRIVSTNVADRRISFGCVNMPVSFYERVLAPRFRQQSGVVYILPESSQLASVFPFTGQGASGAGLPGAVATSAR